MSAYTPPLISRITLFIVAQVVVVANKKVVEANFAATNCIVLILVDWLNFLIRSDYDVSRSTALPNEKYMG